MQSTRRNRVNRMPVTLGRNHLAVSHYLAFPESRAAPSLPADPSSGPKLPRRGSRPPVGLLRVGIGILIAIALAYRWRVGRILMPGCESATLTVAQPRLGRRGEFRTIRGLGAWRGNRFFAEEYIIRAVPGAFAELFPSYPSRSWWEFCPPAVAEEVVEVAAVPVPDLQAAMATEARRRSVSRAPRPRGAAWRRPHYW